MVTTPSRRSFLTGRRTPATPWGSFCARLARTCLGRVRWDDNQEVMQAWLEPAREGDLTHAFALCREFGVQYLLAGADVRPAEGRGALWVSSQAPWAQIVKLDANQGVVRADAGVLVRELQGLGIHHVEHADPEQTVAQWIASARCGAWPTGQCYSSGILQIQVLLADGTTEVLGPFGASAQAPLRSLATQRMIPKLFELAHSASTESISPGEIWPLRYRLDALRPIAPTEPNLAWLFSGHGGALGWVQTVWFANQFITPVNPNRDASVPRATADRSIDGIRQVQGGFVDIDRAVKQILDPSGVFGSIPE